MQIDFKTYILIVAALISAVMERLKIVQNPATDDQTKMGILSAFSAVGAVLLIGGQHLTVAPNSLLTWNDAYQAMLVFAGIVVSSQFYHIGVNKFLDAILEKYKGGTTTVTVTDSSGKSEAVKATYGLPSEADLAEAKG